ncbi:MAG TPA: hypothetical protein VK211_01090, partial [Kamptonema sp.]|nr:hypothetical protein [Kamptonema sp.]
RSKGVKARLSRIWRASCWMGSVMEIARCKQLFHPTSRSDRSFNYPIKSDRASLGKCDRFTKQTKTKIIKTS